MAGLVIAVVSSGLPIWAKEGAKLDLNAPEQVIVFPDWFQAINDIEATPDGTVWILADNMLHGLDEQGAIRTAPTSYRFPRALAYNETSKRLCVMDLDGLHLLGVDGDTIAQVEIRKSGITPMGDLLIPYDKGFLVVGYNEKTGNVLNIFNENGEFLRSFGDPVQNPEVVKFPPTILIPFGLSASGKWLVAVDPFAYDLLIYKDEVLTHRVRLPIPSGRLFGLVPEIKLSVEPEITTTTIIPQASVRTAIFKDVVLVGVASEGSPSVSAKFWFWAVDLTSGEILNAMTVDITKIERYISFLGLDNKGDPLFWNNEGIFSVPVVSQQK